MYSVDTDIKVNKMSSNCFVVIGSTKPQHSRQTISFTYQILLI